MKRYLFLFAILLSFPISNIHAEDVLPSSNTTIHLTITASNSIYDQNIDVSPCNNDNGATSDTKTTAYCAIIQSGIPSDWNWAWAPGAFLNSLNNIAGFTSKDSNDNDVYHYWSWSLNGVEAMTALNQYELQQNDNISITFIDPTPPTPEPEVIPTPRGGGGGILATISVATKTKPVFDIKKAYEFLISQQKENGSFGSDLYTDWSAFPFAVNSDYQNQKEKLVKYLTETKNKDYNLTDYERHTMSLMALGINPYDVNGENYIEKITKEFDGEQFGNKEEDNDDIFALIVLQNAGYKQDEKIIKDTINFILSKQKENGSWDNNVDMTGAAIQAIHAFAGENFLLRGVSQADEPRGSAGVATPDSDLGKEEFSTAKATTSALSKAREFIKQNQKDDGGFGNVSATAWAMGGIISLGENANDWPARNADSIATAGGSKNDNTPFDYLGENQDIDGATKDPSLENKIWQTSYVLSIMSGKTWNQIMQKFEKPIVKEKEVKTETNKTPEKIITKEKPKINKIAKIASENIASPTGAINQIQEEKTIPKQNWFRRLISSIFGL